MYIVNTSFFVDPNVHEQWLGIITGRYLPFLKKEDVKVIAFSRVVSESPGEGFTYSLQMAAHDISEWRRITEELFTEYAELSEKMFGERVGWLTTLMKRVDF